MTPSEFKAWFDGFTEGFEGEVPTQKQWDKIKKRVKDIDGTRITERIFLDSYRRRYFDDYRYAIGAGTMSCSASSGSSRLSASVDDGGDAFNSLLAMKALGNAEAKAA